MLSPTRFARNAIPARLDTIAANAARLRVDNCEQGVGEEHAFKYQNGLPDRFEEAAMSLLPNTGRLMRLIVVFAKQSALLQILATNAVPRPRHRIEALLRQCLAAMNTLAIAGRFDPRERFVN